MSEENTEELHPEELHARFEAAQEEVKTLSERPDNDTLLFLYAHYKQGSHGDVTGKRPGMLDLVNRAKWDAWKKLEGMPGAEAKKAYIDKVRELKALDS